MPRPRRPAPEATGVGAALGALLGGWPGLAVGGAVGAALSSTPVPLEVALRMACEERGLEFVSAKRMTLYALTLVFGRGPRAYWSIQARAPHSAAQTPESLDDGLYDDAVKKLDQWTAAHAA